jgi:ERCC4-type nuclease
MEGFTLAQKMTDQPVSMPEGIKSDETNSEVILFVDNREKRNNQDGSYLFDRLVTNGLTVELKSLPLGDFLWVLRVYHEVRPSQSDQQEKSKKGTKKGKK